MCVYFIFSWLTGPSHFSNTCFSPCILGRSSILLTKASESSSTFTSRVEFRYHHFAWLTDNGEYLWTISTASATVKHCIVNAINYFNFIQGKPLQLISLLSMLLLVLSTNIRQFLVFIQNNMSVANVIQICDKPPKFYLFQANELCNDENVLLSCAMKKYIFFSLWFFVVSSASFFTFFLISIVATMMAEKISSGLPFRIGVIYVTTKHYHIVLWYASTL